MFKLGKMLCYWTSRVMVPNCTFMFSNTSFELSACFPHVAQSTRTTQHLNSVGCFTRNRSSNLKSFTRRGIMKGLRFIHKMTLLTATTLPWLKKCVGCGTKQICPNQHVAQIGSSPSWELRTASPRGHYGERLQRDSCLKKHMKKHHPLAGDSPWRHYRRDHNIRTAGWIHH